jgi:tRNA (adenine37-N6)-methyltransferase
LTRHVSRVVYTPIGIIHSPLKDQAGSPIQSVSAKNVEGVVEVFPPYAEGLKDIVGFSHLILIYHFHLVCKASLVVKPYLEKRRRHGIFSTRSPSRPNSVGISTVKVERVRGARIYVRGIDMLDGTPLLDIKPYVPTFDSTQVERIGWYAGKLRNLPHTKADNRFAR